ncbi:MAG TPA: hypothetical protein VGW78_04095 [Candidatus Babeliales bacterium]|jgi:hypothetical protein|nr:hypothetical protein [Candidatus Babeliales bacterium]
MLLWQHRNIRKLSAWMQLIAISSFLHLILLAMIFFLYNYNTVVTSIHIIHKKSSDIPIFVVGYAAHTKQSIISVNRQKTPQAKKQSSTISNTAKQKTMPSTKPIQKKLPQPKIAAPIPECQPATQIKKIETAKDNKKEVIKAPNAPETPKVPDKPKLESAKQELIKPIKQQKDKISKNKPQEITKPNKQLEIHQNDSVVDIPQDISADAPVVVVNNYREKVALTKQYAFEKLISQAWSAPVGAQGHSCTIKVYIGRQGSIQKMEMIKSSGIVMYDVQARSTLMHIDMPQDVWGTVLEISFES